MAHFSTCTRQVPVNLPMPADTLILEQGCAGAAGHSSHWKHPRESNSRRITSSVRSDLIYDRDSIAETHGERAIRSPKTVDVEVGSNKLFTFTRFPKSQWKSIRTSNAIERLHEEFKRRIKTQTLLPSAETAAMLFWALLASGQITMRADHNAQSQRVAKPQRKGFSPHDRVTSSCWRSC
jgi:hypothetical protein